MAQSNLAQMTFEMLTPYAQAAETFAPTARRQHSLLSLAEEVLRLHVQHAPPTQANVYYWRELLGALTLRGTAGMADGEWPADLVPSQHTLKQMVDCRLVVRRRRAWHLRRDWYIRITALRRVAVATPVLTPLERPAPDLPTYAELKDFETICCYLDAQPKSHARVPFAGLDIGLEGDVPVTALRLMRRYRLVRHTTRCEWALSPKWQERLKALWQGVNTALREYQPAQLALAFPRSLVAGVDTWHLNWVVEHPLPQSLRDRLDRWQEQARDEETELETDLMYDDAPLLMYRWGTKAEKGKEGKSRAGVSWGYVLLNKSLRLLIRKSPLGGIVAQARLGSECLWRRTPIAALDELTLLMKRLWQGQKGSWQVSQVHLCHDVTNVPLTVEMLSRFVSRSRQRAVYEAAQAEVQRITQARYGVSGDDLDDLMMQGIDWAAEFAEDDPMSAFSAFGGGFGYGEVFADDEGTGWGTGWGAGLRQDTVQEEVPAEERATSVYQYGKRLSGLTFSPGGAITVAIYLKRLESLLRRKVHMFPLWKAAGWDGEVEVTRTEARLRREALRELRLPGVEHASLDDPYEMLKHLEGIFGLVVGRTDDCPDAVNTAWLRLVQPRENETNRSRWDTDPSWRVVQAAAFTTAPAPARRIIRRKQRAHNVEQLTVGAYGYLVSLITEQFPAGEQWDVSRGIGELAQHLRQEAEKPGKDFGELVRQRRKERGLSVLPREEVLPMLPALRLTPQPVLMTADASAQKPEPELATSPLIGELDGQTDQLSPTLPTPGDQALLRVVGARQRMEEARHTWEQVGWRKEAHRELVRASTVYEQERTTYTVAVQSYVTLLEQQMFAALEALEEAENGHASDEALLATEAEYQQALVAYSKAFAQFGAQEHTGQQMAAQ